MTTKHLRWQMRPAAFHGAGSYLLNVGENQLLLQVASDGTFETEGQPALPLYPFASLIR